MYWVAEVAVWVAVFSGTATSKNPVNTRLMRGVGSRGSSCSRVYAHRKQSLYPIPKLASKQTFFRLRSIKYCYLCYPDPESLCGIRIFAGSSCGFTATRTATSATRNADIQRHHSRTHMSIVPWPPALGCNPCSRCYP